MTSQLQLIVDNSGLEPTKSQYILDKFQSYFQIASEWETKAKTIVVTNDSQIAEMKMARSGRLFLKDKRISIEKARKKLKEQSLREGKAIDGIANVLKGLIEPIEKYLDEQEHFVEIRAKKIAEQKRIEAEHKAEQERIAREKAESEERERIRLENERLKKDAAEKERLAEIERKKIEEENKRKQEEHDRLIRQEQEKTRAAQEKADTEIRAIEENNRKEKETAERKAAEEKRLIQEREREKARIAREKAYAERKEKERLEKILANQITCPYCGKKFERGTK